MFHRKLSKWFQERGAAGIAAILIGSKDPIAALADFHKNINDDVIDNLVCHSFRLLKEGDHETALLWSDVARQAALLGGSAKALANCFDWRASLLHKLHDKGESDSGDDAHLKEALTCAHKALDICREAGLDADLPPAHGRISVLYDALGQRLPSLEHRLLSAIGWASLSDADKAMPQLMANTHKLLSSLRQNELKQGGELVIKNSTALLKATRALNNTSQGDVRSVLGEACRLLERENEAVDWWQQAIDQYRAAGARKSEFETWWRLQDYAYDSADAEKIVAYGKCCIESAPGDISDRQLGSRYRLLAFGHKILEQSAEAVSMFHRAADLFRKDTDSSDLTGECLLEAGILEEELGLIAEAERDLKEVLNRSGGAHRFWLVDLKLAELLWKKRGDLGAAASYAERAVATSVGLGFSVRGPALELSALIYLQAGDVEKALARSVELLRLLDKESDPELTIRISPLSQHSIVPPKKLHAAFLATILSFHLHREEDAKNYWSLYESTIKNGDTQETSIEEFSDDDATTINLRSAAQLVARAEHLLMTDPKQATVILENCLELLGNFNPALITTNHTLGIAHQLIKEYEPARRAFQRALTLLSQAPDIAEEIICRLNLGLTEARDGNMPAAYKQFRRVVQLKEAQRASLTGEEQRLLFVQNETETYKMLIVACYELGYFAEALETIEKIKSRVMLDLMSTGMRKPIDYSALGKIKTLTQKREAWYSERLQEPYDSFEQRLNALMEADPERARTWLYTSINLEDEITTIKEDLQKAGLLAELQSSSAPLSFNEIRELCKTPAEKQSSASTPDRRIVLVEYFPIDTVMLVFGVRDDFDKPRVVEIPMPLDVARDLMSQRFRINERENQAFAEFQEQFGRLIEPVEEWANEDDVVWFVPHGCLHSLPLHALKLGDRYLIERNPVFYSPSASVQRTCWAHRKGKHERALVLGDSSEVQRLPFARAEARAIAGVFETEPILGPKASKQFLEQRFREPDGEIDILHIACHGRFSNDNPLKSGILLGDQVNDDEPDSNILTAEEIFGFKLPVDLVTLSCCETGISENRSGDELIGLTRALIYAGAASLIASLWSVNDLSTRILMEHFYRELKAGRPKVDALQRAQLAVMKMTQDQRHEYLSSYRKRNVTFFDFDEENDRHRADPFSANEFCFSNPYYWAPFVLIGDWN